MKRNHKTEAAIVAIIILVCLAILIYQFRFNRKFLCERAHLLYEQERYDEAVPLYVTFLSRFAEGQYVSEARQELFSTDMTDQIAKEGRRAIPGLVRTLESDASDRIRFFAATALGKIRDKSVVPALVMALDDDYKMIRYTSMHHLQKITNAPTDMSECVGFSGVNEDELAKVVAELKVWYDRRRGEYE